MEAWLIAFRLRTLPLSLSCIVIGSAISYKLGTFDYLIFILLTSTTILLQILSNLANDYGDSEHGADNDEDDENNGNDDDICNCNASGIITQVIESIHWVRCASVTAVISGLIFTPQFIVQNDDDYHCNVGTGM